MTSPALQERYQASVVLAAVGDAIGYNNGTYEFNLDTESIHSHVQLHHGGVPNIDIRGWRVSDDTVMHLATLRALVVPEEEENGGRRGTGTEVHNDEEQPQTDDELNTEDKGQAQAHAHTADVTTRRIDKLMRHMAQEYIDCWDDMGGRAPGGTCRSGVQYLERVGVDKWYTVPWKARSLGCGASMRAMACGLRYHGTHNRDMLVACGIESGRLTHNHPTGFMGGVVSGAFTAFAIEDIPVHQWGYHLMNDIIPRSIHYLKTAHNGRDWSEHNEEAIRHFIDQWERFLKERGLSELNKSGPVFPDPYGIRERDEFYMSFSIRGWPGACGDDSVIIAYDALLGAGDNWEELMLRGALHHVVAQYHNWMLQEVRLTDSPTKR